MGCGPSKEADTSAPHASPQPRAPPSKPTIATKPVVSSASDSKPGNNSEYETELAASLAGGSGVQIAFHGLLSDEGRLSLIRSPNDGSGKVFEKACHPQDDVVSSVEADADLSRVSGVAMTMPYVIIAGKPGAHAAIEKIAGEVFDRCNSALNGWNPESDVSKLNQAGPDKKVSVSAHLLKLFDVVDEMYEVTDGRFDPTTGTLGVAFENCIVEKQRAPLPSEVKNYKYAIGWKKRVDRKGSNVARRNGNTVLDFDGITKGFVIDELVEALVAVGFANCYVDWAGDIRTSGVHPSGRPWRSAVVLPPALKRVFKHWQDKTLRSMLNENDIGYFADFSFGKGSAGGAIATSGDYFSILKYGFHHISSPKDVTVLKANANSIGSVCIAASSCAVADAVATAAMTFGSVPECVQFLMDLSSQAIIQGYCVMDRKALSEKEGVTFSPAIFTTCERKTTEEQNPLPTAVSGVSDKEMQSVFDRLVLKTATLCYKDSTLEINSWTSCSMDPYPVVTFVVPSDFVKGATTDEESESSKATAYLIGTASDPRISNRRMIVDISFRQFDKFGEHTLVAAEIESVDIGVCNTTEVTWRGNVLLSRTLKLSMPRSAFGIAEVEDKAKNCFQEHVVHDLDCYCQICRPNGFRTHRYIHVYPECIVQLFKLQRSAH